MTIHTIGHIWCDDKDCAVLDKLAAENKRLRTALERIATSCPHEVYVQGEFHHHCQTCEDLNEVAREALEEVSND